MVRVARGRQEKASKEFFARIRIENIRRTSSEAESFYRPRKSILAGETIGDSNMIAQDDTRHLGNWGMRG